MNKVAIYKHRRFIEDPGTRELKAMLYDYRPDNKGCFAGREFRYCMACSAATCLALPVEKPRP